MYLLSLKQQPEKRIPLKRFFAQKGVQKSFKLLENKASNISRRSELLISLRGYSDLIKKMPILKSRLQEARQLKETRRFLRAIAEAKKQGII